MLIQVGNLALAAAWKLLLPEIIGPFELQKMFLNVKKFLVIFVALIQVRQEPVGLLSVATDTL